MPWLMFDDNFWQHPKVVAAGPLAADLHAAAIGYCGRHLTDGFLPAAIVRTLVNFEGICVLQAGKHRPVSVKRLVGRLLEVHLWEEAVGGYRIHDYLDYQRSRAEVLERRNKKVEAGRLGGRRMWERHRSGSSGTAGRTGDAASLDGDSSPQPRASKTQARAEASAAPSATSPAAATAVARVVASAEVPAMALAAAAERHLPLQNDGTRGSAPAPSPYPHRGTDLTAASAHDVVAAYALAASAFRSRFATARDRDIVGWQARTLIAKGWDPGLVGRAAVACAERGRNPAYLAEWSQETWCHEDEQMRKAHRAEWERGWALTIAQMEAAGIPLFRARTLGEVTSEN